ncbi:MAG: Flagellar basal body rod protein FlgB [Turneriella sp.]|nr:Flagellar basal body rod protein FlgB [Turneriella sp.]
MITETGLWGRTTYLLEKGLDVAQMRHKVFADNLANADTPHFKRSEVTFEAELRRVIETEKDVAENAIPARLDDERHIPFYRTRDIHDVKARPQIDYLSTMRNDGNNVDPEHEVAEQTKNMMTYQALTNLLSHNFRTIGIVNRVA